MNKVIGVVLNTEYDVRYERVTASRVHIRSYSTRIAEVQDPGTTDEREAPAGLDSDGSSTPPSPAFRGNRSSSRSAACAPPSKRLHDRSKWRRTSVLPSASVTVVTGQP